MKEIELYNECCRGDYTYFYAHALNDKPQTVSVDTSAIAVIVSGAVDVREQFTGEVVETKLHKEREIADYDAIDELERQGYVLDNGKMTRKRWMFFTEKLPYPTIMQEYTETRKEHLTRTVNARYVEGKNRDGVVLFSGWEIIDE